jgi:2-amino-4-hydroxy-6-hydroxymethyldihydropteridine diphosphokinase
MNETATTPVLIGLGTNVPKGALAGPALLEAALSAIEAAGVKITARSGFWSSPAWPPDDPPQPDFTNMVAAVSPEGWTAASLYRVLEEIELQFGRERRVRWAARTLDIDILDFSGQVSEEGLSLPHPRLHERAFVLAPLAEIAPDWRHPVLRKSVTALLARLGDVSATRRLGD